MKAKARTSDESIVKRVFDYESILRKQEDDSPTIKAKGRAAINMAAKGYEQIAASQGIETGGQGVWDSEEKAILDAVTLKSLFFTDTWVYIVVDLAALKISSQLLQVKSGKVVDGELQVKPAEGHPFQAVIERPNSFQAYHSWMYNLIVDLILTGNSAQWYAPATGKILGLPTENLMLKLDDTGNVESYSVAEGGGDASGPLRNMVTFKPEEIIHFRRPNPSSLLWGLSPFIAGSKSVLFNRYSQDYLNSFYQKGAIPGLALEMDKEANERVAMRLLRSFEQAYTGRRNMRRTIILPKGVTVKEISHSLANQQLALYIDKNREDIINLLKVPKHELSLQQAGSLGSEEAKTALRNFWHATLIPTMRIVESELTNYGRMQGFLDADHFVEFNLEGVEALQDDEIKKAELGEKMLKTHTLNEVRKKVYNMPPIDGGDALPGQGGGGFMPFLSAQAPMQLAAPMAAISAVDVVPETQSGTSLVVSKDKMVTFLKGDDDWFVRRQQKIAAQMGKAVRDMEKHTLTMFSDMAAAITRVAKTHLKEKGWDEYVTKATEGGNPKQSAAIVKPAELRRRLRKGLDKFDDKWIDNTRNTLVAQVELGYEASLIVPFNLPSGTAIAEIRERSKQLRIEAVEDRQDRAFGYIKEGTINRVFGTIERGVESNKTVQEIAESLRKDFSDVAQIGARAMTIARTETRIATSLGQAAAMKDAAQVVPDMKKLWVATLGDDRTRDSHEALHGELKDWDQPFSNDLFFPLDPTGSPEEVINCRCTFIMVPDELAKEMRGDVDLFDPEVDNA